MDIAALGFEVDSSQARGAAKALADLNSAAITAANGAAKFEKTLRGVDGRFRSTNDYLAENIREVEALARAYNPVMAAQNAYRDEVLRTATAVKAGVITEQQRAAILAQTKERLEQASIASARFGQAQTVASHHVANLSFQLNDIGMMMASGQSPFMLMIQQGPQVAQIFQQLKQSGQSLGGTLAGAFRMILNPTTLVTLAVIGAAAGIAKLVTSASGAEGQLKSLDDTLSDLADSTRRISETNVALTSSAEQTRLKYGALTAEVRSLIAAQNELARIDAMQQMNAAVNSLTEAIRGPSGLWGALFDIGDGARLNELRMELGLSLSQTNALGVAMRNLNAAASSQDKLKALTEMRVLMQGFGQATGWADAELVAMYKNVVKAEDATRQAVAATNGWASSMSGVLGYVNAVGRALSNIGGGYIDYVAQGVEIELLKQGKTLQESSLGSARERARLESKQIVDGLKIQNDLVRKGAELVVNATKQARINRAEELAGLQEVARKREAAAAKAAGGGGGGGGGSARAAAAELKQAEKGFQSLRELLEKDTLFQFAEYEKRQAQLKAALDKRLVTQQQYQEYEAALRIQYFGTEYQQRQLQYDLELQQLKQALEQQLITRQEYDALMRQRQWEQISQLGQIRDAGTAYELNQMATAFGEAASMAGDYNQKFLKAQRIFAASAALISTYQGAAKALELPFPMNIAAAAKVIAAGLGFVSAIKSGGSSSGGRGSGSSASSATTKTEPTRQVLVRLEGDDWLVDMAENIMTQIYDQSKDGRVIVARDRS